METSTPWPPQRATVARRTSGLAPGRITIPLPPASSTSSRSSSAAESSSSSSPVPSASRTTTPVSTGEEKPQTRTAGSSAAVNTQSLTVPRLRSATNSPCPAVRSLRQPLSVGELPAPTTKPCPVVSRTVTSSRTVRPVLFTNTPTTHSRTVPRTTLTELSCSTATPGLSAADISQSSTSTCAWPLARTPLPRASRSRLARTEIRPRSPATTAEVPRCSTTQSSSRLSVPDVATTPAPAGLLIRH